MSEPTGQKPTEELKFITVPTKVHVRLIHPSFEEPVIEVYDLYNANELAAWKDNVRHFLTKIEHVESKTIPIEDFPKYKAEMKKVAKLKDEIFKNMDRGAADGT